MDTKLLGQVEIKDGDKGEFTAVIATYNVVDKDGDVTLPGAHKDGQRVVVSPYQHSSMSGQQPVGSGTLHVERGRTVVKGSYFMDIPDAASAFLTMKRLHSEGLGEWSYGYDVIDAEMGEQDGQRVRLLKAQDVYEVSHVLRGAGINTRTLSAKNADPDQPATKIEENSMDIEYRAAIRPHKSAVTARTWDSTAVMDGIPDGTSVSDLRSMAAWVDPAGDPESKGSYGFVHHHGPDGPANVRALIVGIAALNGAHGAQAIPEADRKAVYQHLADHLTDAGREPPELRPTGENDGQLKLHEEAISALAGVEDYLASAERVVALRSQKNKRLSNVNLEALDWVGEDLRRMVTKHAELVRRLGDTPKESAAIEFARFQARRFRSAS